MRLFTEAHVIQIALLSLLLGLLLPQIWGMAVWMFCTWRELSAAPAAGQTVTGHRYGPATDSALYLSPDWDPDDTEIDEGETMHG